MSLLSTVLSDGIKGLIAGIPSIYLWAGGAAAVLAAAIGLRIYWDHEVALAANARINAYIASVKKDEADLAEVTTRNNAKIQLVYQDRIQTITKVVHDNQNTIDTQVPDANTMLSTGWVTAFNASAAGVAIDPTAASNKTPSGVNADQALDAVNTNNGLCLSWKAQVDAWQNWYNTQKAAIDAQNKKDGSAKR